MLNPIIEQHNNKKSHHQTKPLWVDILLSQIKWQKACADHPANYLLCLDHLYLPFFAYNSWARESNPANTQSCQLHEEHHEITHGSFIKRHLRNWCQRTEQIPKMLQNNQLTMILCCWKHHNKRKTNITRAMLNPQCPPPPRSVYGTTWSYRETVTLWNSLGDHFVWIKLSANW